ncbi:unnamed protein product [Mytilus edulis]|uniref:THAP-type domain-containing protein n=1 Tax=Mytilus edulis TaxID=6550 RepID=A0A8S3VPU2_MYTED|nr:unnamed protein product [Mytilus edulis]
MQQQCDIRNCNKELDHLSVHLHFNQLIPRPTERKDPAGRKIWATIVNRKQEKNWQPKSRICSKHFIDCELTPKSKNTEQDNGMQIVDVTIVPLLLGLPVFLMHIKGSDNCERKPYDYYDYNSDIDEEFFLACAWGTRSCDCSPPFQLIPFPTERKDPAGRKKWTAIVNRKQGNNNWQPNSESRICSKHFVDGEPTPSNPFPILDGLHTKSSYKAPLHVKDMTVLLQKNNKAKT